MRQALDGTRKGWGQPVVFGSGKEISTWPFQLASVEHMPFPACQCKSVTVCHSVT